MTPLVYLAYGDGFAVVPAKAGRRRPTDRLVAQPPSGRLGLHRAGRSAAARHASDRHRDRAHERLWLRFRAVTPVEHYQRGTRGTLPVVMLTPVGAAIRTLHRAPARTSRLAL
jgi:hypothetical protein